MLTATLEDTIKHLWNVVFLLGMTWANSWNHGVLHPPESWPWPRAWRHPSQD